MATGSTPSSTSRQPLGDAHGRGRGRRAGGGVGELVQPPLDFRGVFSGFRREGDGGPPRARRRRVRPSSHRFRRAAPLTARRRWPVGFVGAAGTRNLSRELVWWRGARAGRRSRGLVHHGASRRRLRTVRRRGACWTAFSSPRAAASLRAVRLGPPAALRRAPGWHFYDASYCRRRRRQGAQRRAAARAAPRARGVTDERWEAARAALALRLRPALPRAASAPSRRAAPTAGSRCCCRRRRRRRLRAAVARCARRCAPPATSCCSCARAAMGAAGGRSTRSDSSRCIALFGAGAGDDAAGGALATNLDELGELGDDDTLLVASGASLPLTPPADIDLLLEAALRDAAVGFAAPLGCRAWCDRAGGGRRRGGRCGRVPLAGRGGGRRGGGRVGPRACRCTRRRPARRRPSTRLRAAASSPASCVPSAACTATPPAARHRCATRCAPTTPRRRCHTSCSTRGSPRVHVVAAAVAPIVSVHLAPWPAGRCAPDAAALPAALRAVLCV